MLRHVVGDTTFFDILHAYYGDSRYQYATATTEQFRDVCEDVSGIDLDWFFHEWIYEEYYPSYSYEWSTAPVGDNWDINLTIQQNQTHYIFKMPIDILVQTSGGDTTLVVWDSLATQTFTLTVNDMPAAIQFDPEQWILRSVSDPVPNPTFDRGILLVNGMSWNGWFYPQVVPAYEDSVFWGSHPFTFWDYFDQPAGGYPANLPSPLGHGAVPPDTIQQFSAVVWLGNYLGGDIVGWGETPIRSYLNAGGNVLLIAPSGIVYIDPGFQAYLGITIQGLGVDRIGNCISTWPGLVDIGLDMDQGLCALLDTTLTSVESVILFEDTISSSTPSGVGVWHAPSAGGTHRGDGGQMVFLSGWPQLYNHDDLRANIDYILSNFFNEPYTPPTAVTPAATLYPFELRQNYPNPFNPHTTIRFSVPQSGPVSLRVYDVAGRLVTVLSDRKYPAGEHTVSWDGMNRRGESVASGIYFYKIVAGDRNTTKKMVLLR